MFKIKKTKKTRINVLINSSRFFRVGRLFSSKDSLGLHEWNLIVLFVKEYPYAAWKKNKRPFFERLRMTAPGADRAHEGADAMAGVSLFHAGISHLALAHRCVPPDMNGAGGLCQRRKFVVKKNNVSLENYSKFTPFILTVHGSIHPCICQ